MRRLGRRSFRDMAWSIGLSMLGVCLIAGRVLAAQEVVIVDFGQEKDGVPPAGWELLKKRGKPDLALINDGIGQVLRLRSDSASFSLQKEVEIDLMKTPYLEWQWRVTELPKGGDFRRSSTDDQAAQLYVMFTPDFLRKEVIAYVWDSTAPTETVGEPSFPPVYPFLGIKVIVVESGDTKEGKWITETRNVLEDYKKLFGGEPGKITGIRIQINSQHTKSKAESYWAYVKLKARP
ncbi:MAG: DUF3047 domain-containing protein [Acidobacteriota bacterium]